MRLHLFVFDLKAEGRRRNEFYRRLLGRTVVSKGRRYQYDGLLSNMKGWRWATRSALLVPAGEAGKIREFFKEWKNLEFEEFEVVSI